MTISNGIVNASLLKCDVQSQVQASQSTSAANTISAKFPQQSNPNSQLNTNTSNTIFGSLTQAYKDSYDKFQKEKADGNQFSLKSLLSLNKILESEDLINKANKEENDEQGVKHFFELLA